MMKNHRNRERGIALLFSLMALLILSAIAASMIFMSNTETAINANYRLEQRAYFAALGGMEEVRQRMSVPGSLILPAILPSTSGGVLYVLNPAGASDVVQPWNPSNQYFDSELCHENFYASPTNPGTGIRCTAVPAGASWYTTATSTEPFYNTKAALDYKWVRVTLKENNTSAPYYVNGSNASSTLNTEACLSSTGQETLAATGSTTCQGANAASPYFSPVLMGEVEIGKTGLQVRITKQNRFVESGFSAGGLVCGGGASRRAHCNPPCQRNESVRSFRRGGLVQHRSGRAESLA